MHLNTTPDPPPGKPNILEYAELLRDYLPEPLIKLVPLPELRRRCHEITAEHPRFREEVPLVLSGETHRRERLSGRLVLADARQSQVA